MTRLPSLVASALILLLPLASPCAAAPDPAPLFEAKTVTERNSALAALEAAAPSDPASAYAAGAGEFFTALEILAGGLHRHGFESPQSFMLPLMRLPVPDNPNPEPLTYEEFRAILVAFRDRLQKSAATLGSVPADADIGMVIDLTRLGIDLNEDGNIARDESAASIMAALSRGGAPDGPAPSLTFRFDRADGYWLQGYAEFLMAQADFWLAHDFKTMFDGSFHMLFPRAKLPLQDVLVPPDGGMSGSIFASEWRFADFISLVHLVNWPVVEPERRQAARRHLLEMIRLSREDWKAIRAETDNDREWLPGPKQKGPNPLTGLEVGEEQVTAWLATLDMAEDLLEGRVLLPHFRVAGKGINMKRFFDEPKTFDLVLSITGPAIAPYFESGRILTGDDFDQIQREFGGAGFLTFALWFN
ncbi:hypothetical protein EN858_32915 [Mesorhizobium sp. M4B.F.Ca.ET.215.01.1.1]|uniref:hypothetical protein n=2 Tax=Mesorhizobium TaxID=68287 RepID=UPI000FE370C2|nr:MULTISPECIES: hypothetical protein [unclassified Mesorhizobium]RWF60006.1 MAG: hypothetical protein EOS47_31790 [Mesorhizobium sp.]RWX61502.1 hypothetical protein EN780_29195 [Mesorhizobium sp. M4B.F.Ca.ET.089.01.1.1]TGQ04068.1 hypothetical protein EN858_32915 [Mesorhizobium sp. M4B.F.Ca.ET.215.01.1.1]TGQ24980.1 hypothetical protein EN863_059520 [Mesorhizobium sp. M00.F.Ca.ET.220.01.1.1]TGQ34335.1 hypothetical protein EN857_19905 [Mesorhizobium sp. M4B.F.Ca.ET.214.01.1.1]